MSTTHHASSNGTSEPFTPAFCHRGDCKADPSAPFCAGCGADIAGYLRATSVAQQPAPLDEATTKVMAAARELDRPADRRVPAEAAPRPDDRGPARRLLPQQPDEVASSEPGIEETDPPASAPLSRRVVAGSFAAASAAGAGLGIVVGLV